MPLRRLIHLTLLACVLYAPATVAAADGPHAPATARRATYAQAASAPGADPATDPQIAQWLQVAQAYWNAAPSCPNGVTIQRAQWLPDPGVWAAAIQGGCSMAFDPDFYPAPADYDSSWWQAAMCSVVAHEWGHLLGYGHVSDPSSLMNPVTPINLVGGCPTWGIPAAGAAPSQSTPATPATTTSSKKKAGKKRSTCGGRGLKRAKAPKRCAAPAKKQKRKSRR